LLAQGLPNTVDIELGRDGLTTVDDLARFAREHGIDGPFSADDVRCVRDVREALRAICGAHAGLGDAAGAESFLTSQLARAPLVVALRGGGVRLEAAGSPRGLPALLARLAVNIAEAQEAGDWQRLKACRADSCRWVYYDRSPGGRGRWCSMSLCGSRAKMRSYRARMRQ
jgi:predicted RNA-binding Zn ribbon-like protein